MAVPTDNRLLDAPMQPVRCLRCDAEVEVRKSSWQQTSIQWHASAMATCEERRQEPAALACRIDTCSALRESIERAATRGDIDVPDDKY